MRDRVFSLGSNKFAIQHRVVTQETVLCKIIKSGTDWFTSPLNSIDLDYSYKTTITNCTFDTLDKTLLIKQAIMIPVNEGGFVFTPLLHTV